MPDVQVRFERITPSIGAFAHVEDVLAPGVPQQLLDALETYDVVVLPQTTMSDETFVAMTGAMGSMHDLGVTAEGGTKETAAGVYRVSLDKDDPIQLDFVRGNDFWHMDGTVYKTPGKSTLLKCETPPAAGGDTGFACLDAAYRALPETLRREIEGLRVRHAFRAVGKLLHSDPSEEMVSKWDGFFPPTEHPLVWHRRSGRTSLMIGSTAYDIVGQTSAQAEELFAQLNSFATQDRFTYRHTWRRGDVVMFNNPGLLHRSYPYDTSAGRLLHRTTIRGTEATT